MSKVNMENWENKITTQTTWMRRMEGGVGYVDDVKVEFYAVRLSCTCTAEHPLVSDGKSA